MNGTVLAEPIPHADRYKTQPLTLCSLFITNHLTLSVAGRVPSPETSDSGSSLIPILDVREARGFTHSSPTGGEPQVEIDQKLFEEFYMIKFCVKTLIL